MCVSVAIDYIVSIIIIIDTPTIYIIMLFCQICQVVSHETHKQNNQIVIFLKSINMHKHFELQI